MVMRVCTTLAVAVAVARPPLLAQAFEGVARVSWLMVDSTAMARLGTRTVEEAFAIPRERRRFARIAPGDQTLSMTMLFLSASTINTGRVFGRRGEIAWIDSVRTEVVEFGTTEIRIRWWLAKRSQDADWRAMTRTLSRLRHDPIQLPAIVPPPMPVRAAFINPADGSDGFMMVDYLSIVRGAVPESEFEVPRGFRQVDHAQMDSEPAPRRNATTPVPSTGVDTVRIEGDTTQYIDATVDTRPERLSCPPMEYPRAARDSMIQGRVIVRLVVDTLGRPVVSTVRVTTSPHTSLSAAARQYVLGCTFTPGRVHGRAVRTLVHVPIDFSLTLRP